MDLRKEFYRLRKEIPALELEDMRNRFGLMLAELVAAPENDGYGHPSTDAQSIRPALYPQRRGTVKTIAGLEGWLAQNFDIHPGIAERSTTINGVPFVEITPHGEPGTGTYSRTAEDCERHLVETIVQYANRQKEPGKRKTVYWRIKPEIDKISVINSEHVNLPPEERFPPFDLWLGYARLVIA